MLSLAGLTLGAVWGMRHAFEPDHLAALSVLAARDKTPGRTAWLGLFWGAGHTLSLSAMVVFLAFLGGVLPATVDTAIDILVATMLIAMGIASLWRSIHATRDVRDRDDVAFKSSVRTPVRPCVDRPPTHWRLAARPLLVGLVHGLAGSGALVAMVASRLPTLTAQ
ncbi:MAG: hypothetical protein H7Z43_05515, partial [Clostridia bacterium]|nr:hypothetical protein [Deltaproteobacteria bacterium]